MLTPTRFAKRLGEISLSFIENGNVDFASILLQDSTDTYFSNLKPEESQQLSHHAQLFPHCMLTVEGSRIVAENCSIEGEAGFTKHQFSHPKYFNCWTLETAPNKTTRDTQHLTLLVRLVPSKEIYESKTNFIMDTFSRGEGAKFVIHQSGTYPEIDKLGINVQPGRMNELSFKTERWNRLETLVAPCSDELPLIVDMGRNFSYRLTQCLDTILQNMSMKKCRCLNSEWPRPVDPEMVNTQMPYCSALPLKPDQSTLKDMVKRFNCAAGLLRDIKQIKEDAIRTRRCIPRCTYHTYPVSASITSWDPVPEKLQHFTDKIKAVERLMEKPNDEEEKQRFIRYLKKIINATDSSKKENDNPEKVNPLLEKYSTDSSYTYISLVRSSYDTTFHEERLIFDFYILISRVGGLCSIFIGLTAAIIIEIIEFIFLIFSQRHGEINSTKTNDHALHVTLTNPMTEDGLGKPGSRHSNSNHLQDDTMVLPKDTSICKRPQSATTSAVDI